MFDRTKMGARSIDSFVRTHLDRHAKTTGMTGKQMHACQEAACWVSALVLHDIEIDVEKAEHFANWFAAHFAKQGIAPIDYIIFATYINTARITDPSAYKNTWLP